MLHIKIIDIKENKIKTSGAEAFIKSSTYGASIIFNGTVRNINEDKEVVGMTYDTHDELVLKSFEEIYNEATEKLKIKDKAIFIDDSENVLKCSYKNGLKNIISINYPDSNKEKQEIQGCHSLDGISLFEFEKKFID